MPSGAGEEGRGGIIKAKLFPWSCFLRPKAAAVAFLLSHFVGFSLFFHLMMAFFPRLDNVPTVLGQFKT